MGPASRMMPRPIRLRWRMYAPRRVSHPDFHKPEGPALTGPPSCLELA
jgi:hypothetical protein